MLSEADLCVNYLAKALATKDVELSSTARNGFAAYAEMLVDWNANRFNLTRLISPQQIAIGHFHDSLALTQFLPIPRNATLIDVGTGAGFPGLALKIYRPDIKLTLIESTAKKLTFCEAVSKRLGFTDITFVHGRAEDKQTLARFGEKAKIVTARAVAPLSTLIKWTAPLIAPGGVMVAWKGAKVYEEVEEARSTAQHFGLKMVVERQELRESSGESVVHYYVVCSPWR